MHKELQYTIIFLNLYIKNGAGIYEISHCNYQTL